MDTGARPEVEKRKVVDWLARAALRGETLNPQSCMSWRELEEAVWSQEGREAAMETGLLHRLYPTERRRELGRA